MPINPPLYLFDPDQTHDLLWAERISSNIATLLSNAFQNHGPFSGGSLPVVLVDRYIPGGDSIPWASEWTTTYFEFLKPLSLTHLLNDGEINGSAYGFEPEYQADLPEELNLGADWPSTVKVKVTKGQTGLISWLERAHSECHAGQYCPQVSNQIQVWMRRHKVIIAFIEDLEIELDCRLWLHNSVVVQNASLEGITEAQKRLFRYADLDDVLEDCYSQFNISECKVLTALDVSVETNYSAGFISNSSSPSYLDSYNHKLLYSSPLFQVVPSQYYFASLFYAVPPKRGNKTLFTTEAQRTNLGKPVALIASVTEDPEPEQIPVTFYVSLTYLNLEKVLPENAVSVRWGLDLHQSSAVPVLTAPLPNKIDGSPVIAQLETFANNHNPSPLMPRLAPVAKQEYAPNLPYLATLNRNENSSIAVSSENCFYLSKALEPDPSLLNNRDVIPQPNGERWWYRTDHSTSLPPIISSQDNPVFSGDGVNGPTGTSKKGKFFYFEVPHQSVIVQTDSFESTLGTSALPLEPGWANYGETHYPVPYDSAPFGTIVMILDRYSYRFGTKYVSLLFSGENIDLFQNGETFLCRHDVEFSRYWHQEIMKLDAGGSAQPELGRESLKVCRVSSLLKVNASFPSNLTADRITIISIPSYEAETLYDEAFDSHVQGFFDARIDESWTGTMFNTQRLTRALRIQPLTKPLYVIEQGGDVVFPTEAQFLQLIEPQPGLFFCDPNPDPLQNRNTNPFPNQSGNTSHIGDIMPDSLRVKEIHMALQADKYANDDFDTQKARVANLGWLIDKMANVLGLHFASDGEMLKVRDTEHKKDGDTIPEQWQIGQWGKNNWIAKKSTGQNVAVNGVGYAYEVRSNGFGTDKFTGANTSIEEGGWVLCNSLIQLLETKFDDDDRAFGLQDLGANVIPRADATGYIAYEGMHSLLIEIAYMLSSLSGNITRSEVLDMKSVAILQEILAGLGTPIAIKEMPATIAGQSVLIPYPGLDNRAPTMADMFFWVLANLAPGVASQLVYKQFLTEEEREAAEKAKEEK